MTQQTYAILGTGALGGIYGALLQHGGCEVHFLLRSDFNHIQKNGLKVESTLGDFSLPNVHAYNDVRQMPQCDVVIVALKTTQNDLLQSLLPPVLKDDGVVLVMQNGLGVEDQVAEIVGPNRVMGGLAFLCSNKVAPGHIRHLDYGLVVLAEYAADGKPRGITQRMQRIAADFQHARIPVQMSEDLLSARWKKLVWNIPYNGLSVVLNATTEEIMADPNASALAEQLMIEVVEGGRACGARLEYKIITQMLNNTKKMIPYRTSMKIDYDEGRPMELEAIFGNPLREAAKAGATLPRIQTLHQLLQFLDRRRSER